MLEEEQRRVVVHRGGPEERVHGDGGDTDCGSPVDRAGAGRARALGSRRAPSPASARISRRGAMVVDWRLMRRLPSIFVCVAALVGGAVAALLLVLAVGVPARRTEPPPVPLVRPGHALVA